MYILTLRRPPQRKPAPWLAMIVALCGVISLSAVAQTTCTEGAPLCQVAGQTFAVRSFNPAASAVRVGPRQVVTNRHVVANEDTAEVILADGTRLPAQVIPTSYPGDLVLLRVETLTDGPVPAIATSPAPNTALWAIGFDVGRQAIRIYPPGQLLAGPAADRPLARLHHDAPSQPGNSGGAIVDDKGALVAIIAAGGEGRHDAIPATEIARLKSLSGPAHQAAHARLGLAYRQCMAATDAATRNRRPMTPEQEAFLDDRCRATGNRQLLDLAAQAFGRRGQFKRSIALFETALDQDPKSLNTRLGLVVTLHLAQRFEDEIPHLRELIQRLPADIQVLRFAIQAGTWAGAADLADQGMALLRRHHPKLAPLAERFRNAPPPNR